MLILLKKSQVNLLEAIAHCLEHCLELSKSQNGNYIIQQLLSLGDDDCKLYILNLLKDNILEMSYDKFARFFLLNSAML